MNNKLCIHSNYSIIGFTEVWTNAEGSCTRPNSLIWEPLISSFSLHFWSALNCFFFTRNWLIWVLSHENCQHVGPYWIVFLFPLLSRWALTEKRAAAWALCAAGTRWRARGRGLSCRSSRPHRRTSTSPTRTAVRPAPALTPVPPDWWIIHSNVRVPFYISVGVIPACTDCRGIERKEKTNCISICCWCGMRVFPLISHHALRQTHTSTTNPTW